MTQIDIDEFRELFYVLGLVFIEIRSTDNILRANILADVFHNVPAKISHGFSIEVIMEEIHEKASRHECEKKIKAMFETARKNSRGF